MRDNYVMNRGYRVLSKPGFVYPNAKCGGIPMYGLFKAQGVDYIYTTKVAERDRLKTQGYVGLGVICYLVKL